MLPRPLDTTIAHKAINLMPELSGTEKRIAAAIIDHFNRKIRAVSQIERTGILLKGPARWAPATQQLCAGLGTVPRT